MILRFLLQRPIAVFMSFTIAVILGAFLSQKIPVSLLPNIDVPQITIKVNYPNYSATVIEENIIRNIRQSLGTLDKVANIESQTTNHTASLNLTFEYGADMRLAYIDVNEKLDQLSNSLPKDLPRPQVMRINTSDIPIVRLQVVPKNIDDYVRVAELTEKVIKKRIEQIDGISIVDLNGKRNAIITIDPNRQALAGIGLTEYDIERAIKAANSNLGSLSVKDGHFRFFVSLTNKLENLEQLGSIPLKLKDGTISTVEKFAKLNLEAVEPQGHHLFNGKEGLVLTIQKQDNSRMNELMSRIDTAISIFKKDYPQIEFSLSQDQTFILDQGIQNLIQDLLYGGIFCIILLFLFLGNYASPILMSISIPISLLLTFILFYVFNISYNIISLSGLALGIGLLIDNSIIVLDSITRKRREGYSIDDSCILGVSEVMSPVISNVLTTVAIYAPLIYMSGLAGALVYDQAVALTISLGVSLLVAFCLNPVMYKYLLKEDPKRLKEDTALYLFVARRYHSMIRHIFTYKKTYFIIALLIIPLGIIFYKIIPVTTLPTLPEKETLIKIDWNIPIDANENLHRVEEMMKNSESNLVEWEADVGIKQFILQKDNSGIQKAEIYYKCISQEKKRLTDSIVERWLKLNHPEANWDKQSAPNSFSQLFEDDKPYLEARLRPFDEQSEEDVKLKIQQILAKSKISDFKEGPSFIDDISIEITLNHNRMLFYGITRDNIEKELKRLFSFYGISEIKRFADVKVISFRVKDQNIAEKLNTQIVANNGASYNLRDFVSYSYGNNRRYIQADKTGVYHSIIFNKKDVQDENETMQKLIKAAAEQSFSVTYSGKYFSNKVLLEEMGVILVVSLLLLYFILAIQFENLYHPFLVMLTIPLGISGSMFVLWLAGGTLNIMTAIGLVVVLGIIVDDPSLKIETINRLRQEYLLMGMKDKKEILTKALHEAGELCLKPLLMVSLTTSLALVPVFFTSGIGNDLQKPLAYVIVGGLTIGTFFTLWFIPLAYWFITKKDNKV